MIQVILLKIIDDTVTNLFEKLEKALLLKTRTFINLIIMPSYSTVRKLF